MRIKNGTIAVIITVLFIAVWVLGWVVDPGTSVDNIFNITSPSDLMPFK